MPERPAPTPHELCAKCRPYGACVWETYLAGNDAGMPPKPHEREKLYELYHGWCPHEAALNPCSDNGWFGE